jgi:hypothetical protein
VTFLVVTFNWGEVVTLSLLEYCMLPRAALECIVEARLLASP